MKKLHKNVYVQTTSDGFNVGCVLAEDGAVSIDLPLNIDEALQWRAQIQELTPNNKPLRAIIFTAADRVSSEALKALAPNLGAFSLPSIIQEAGFNQLYATLEASQPRMLEPLSPAQLRERAVLPDLTFSDAATFTLGMQDPVRVDIANAPGGGPGSSMVTVRDIGVVFTGALVTNREPPALQAGDLDLWMATLTNLRRNRKIKTVVPGRGPAGDLTTVAQTMAYLKAAQAGVRKLARAHRTRDSLAPLVAELQELYPSANRASKEHAAAEQELIARRIQSGLERLFDEWTAQASSEVAALVNE
jgi:glyoxylase-like metal-dependent hydrolase (beta-lactamase superfamily II)